MQMYKTTEDLLFSPELTLFDLLFIKGAICKKWLLVEFIRQKRGQHRTRVSCLLLTVAAVSSIIKKNIATQ